MLLSPGYKCKGMQIQPSSIWISKSNAWTMAGDMYIRAKMLCCMCKHDTYYVTYSLDENNFNRNLYAVKQAVDEM